MSPEQAARERLLTQLHGILQGEDLDTSLAVLCDLLLNGIVAHADTPARAEEMVTRWAADMRRVIRRDWSAVRALVTLNPDQAGRA